MRKWWLVEQSQSISLVVGDKTPTTAKSPLLIITFDTNMETLIITRTGDVTLIKLNRPDRYNSFNQAMAFEMQKALDHCSEDGTRCLLITGEGKAFSAGQDLNEVVDPNGPPMQRIVADHYNPIIRRIRDLNIPVIAAVNGAAAGAGANIALSCDIVIAKDSAYFLQAFSADWIDTGQRWHVSSSKTDRLATSECADDAGR
jgi:1,4-dihydroxy-2-naphthoyl-CoA synthase